MHLLPQKETDGGDSLHPPLQPERFLLINVPDRRLLIDHISDQFTVRVPGNAFPDLNGIFAAVQCKDRHHDLIRTDPSKINSAVGHHRFPVPRGCNASFIPVSRFSLHGSVLASGNEIVRVKPGFAQSVDLEFQLGDQPDGIRTAL